ncbi:hypothetical protein EPUL_003866 [Erysiphe pulchra]|uniref:CCHC-type domain-containing protein n=1 Tax=Erysiphe pulchra TaxID=225359 RepID=A0A2S4PSM2_9PEZI|nr:hypothetical protein EPUL_003866 [Erysiphe pulchra]
MKYSKEGILTSANDDLKAKSSKISVVLKAANAKGDSTKVSRYYVGSSRGTLSSLQRQLSSLDPNKAVDEVATFSSQIQAQIGGISIEDKPTELSKKDVSLRCFQERYQISDDGRNASHVASDYSFAQIVETLRQAVFESKEIPLGTALQVGNKNSSSAGKKENQKCYYCGKVGYIKHDCKKKKYNEKSKKIDWIKKPEVEVERIVWKANGILAILKND